MNGQKNARVRTQPNQHEWVDVCRALQIGMCMHSVAVCLMYIASRLDLLALCCLCTLCWLLIRHRLTQTMLWVLFYFSYHAHRHAQISVLLLCASVALLNASMFQADN